MTRHITAVCFILFLFVVIGCSGGSGTPLTPDITGQNLSHGKISGSTPKVLWGYWDVSIDPDTLSVEIVPLRGAEFTCNVTKFLQPPASPIHMLTINILPGSVPVDGYFRIKVNLSHPFPSLNFYRGFDVRGILISDGSYSGIHDPGLVFAGDGDTHLLNPDGYTRWWNAVEFTSYEKIFGFTKGSLAPPVFPTSTLNPYKYFSDFLEEDADLADLDTASRGTFSNTGGVNSRVYEIQFKQNGGMNDFKFNYAIDASWDVPDSDYSPTYPVEAFPLSANCQEAYWISADFTGSTAFWQESTSGGDIHCTLEIGDWQALGDGVEVPDEVAAIWVESPDFMAAPMDVLPMCGITDGNGLTTSVFTFDLIGVTPTGLTDQTMMVTVESTDPNTYKPQIDAGDFFDYPDAPLGAFMMFDVPIIDESPNKTPVVLDIVPSQGAIDTGDLPVVITGLSFAPDAEAKLVNVVDSMLEIPGIGIIVDPGGTEIDCTFDMDSADGALLGFYHVVVTNPGPPPLSGQLDSGFEIIIPSGCDEVYSNEIYSGNLAAHAEQVHSVAINHDGLLVSRVSDGGYHLYGYDVTQNGNVTGTMIVENGLYLEYSLGDIDICDVTHNILYAICGGGYVSTPIKSFVGYTEAGQFIGEYASVNCDHLQGVDTDDDGSVWTIGHSYTDPNPPDPDYSPDKVFFEHWLWDEIEGEYVYDPAGSVDVTADQKYNDWADIYAIAVSYTEDLILVYSPGNSPYKGRVDVYDISSGVPVHSYYFSDFLPNGQGGHAFYNWRTAVDLQIDHSNLAYEHCRVMVSARLWWQYGEAFVKLDTDGTVIDTWENPDADNEGGMYWCHGFNPVVDDPDGIYLVAMEDNVHTGSASGFHVFEMPPGW